MPHPGPLLCLLPSLTRGRAVAQPDCAAPPPRCRRPGQYRSAVADVDSVSCIFYVIFSGGKRSKDIKQPDVRRVKDPALHPVSFIISETGVILWFFDRLRKAPALLAPEPSFFLESYFASTTEILISFSASLRSNAPPSATLTPSSYSVPSARVSTPVPASSVIVHSSLLTSASFPSAP